MKMLAAFAGACVCSLATGQVALPGGSSQPSPANQADQAADTRFRARLEALSPADPERYYLLGEEVTDAAGDAASRRLAVELFVLAFVLDLERGGSTIAAGASIALASLSGTDQDRAWLTAMAQTLDPRRVPPEWLLLQPEPTTDSSSYQIATFLGMVRSGAGVQARQLLEKPGVKAGLERYDRLLMNMGVSGGASGVSRESARWPCLECQNERVVKKAGTNPPEYKMCPQCGGNPGPRLALPELLGQLRFEGWLLQGLQRSWAAQVTTDSGAPLLDPDPREVARSFDVDPNLVLWRNGRWVASPDRPVAPMPARDAAPDNAKPADVPSTPGVAGGY